MTERLRPEDCYDLLLPNLEALVEAIRAAPTDNTPALALSMLYGLFTFVLSTIATTGRAITPEELAAMLVNLEQTVARAERRTAR